MSTRFKEESFIINIYFKEQVIVTTINKHLIVYEIYGDPNGKPLIYFHGWPGSILEAELLEQHAKNYKLKIVAVNRFQTDTIKTNYYKEWADIFNKLLIDLQIDKVDILAVSAGAVHTYAFLNYYPQKIDKVTIVSGMTPLEKNLPLTPHFKLLKFGCDHSKAFISFVVYLLKLCFKYTTSLTLKTMQLCTKGNDPKTLSKKESKTFLYENILSATKNGTKGLTNEICPMIYDWGFDSLKIEKEITLLHGDQDSIIPLKYVKEFIKEKKNFHLKSMQNEGHYSLGLENMEEILKENLKS